MLFALPTCVFLSDGLSCSQLPCCHPAACTSQLLSRSQPGNPCGPLRVRQPRPVLQRVEAVALERSRTATVPAKAEDWQASSSQTQQSRPADTPAAARRSREDNSAQPEEQKQRRGRPRKAPASESLKVFAAPDANRERLAKQAYAARKAEAAQLRRRRRARPSLSPVGTGSENRQTSDSEAPPSPAPSDASQQIPHSQASQRRQQYQSRTPDRPVSAVKRQRARSAPPAPEIVAFAESSGLLTAEEEQLYCRSIKRHKELTESHSDLVAYVLNERERPDNPRKTVSTWLKASGAKSLGAVIQDLRTGSEASKLLISKMKTLVNNTVGRYTAASKLVDRGELTIAAEEAILKAAVKFDETKGTRFPTLAGWYVRAACSLQLQQHSIMQVPVHVQTTVRKLQLATRQYQEDNNGRSPSHQQLADLTNLSVAQVKEADEKIAAVQSSSFPMSLDEPGGDDKQQTLGESQNDVRDEESETASNDLHRSLVQDMHILLDTAIPAFDQRQALKMRYGLATGEPASYVKIARTLGISNQAAVTVVQRAFDTLRQQRGLWERILDPYIQNGYLMSERNPAHDPARNLGDYFACDVKPDGRPGSKPPQVSGNTDFAAALNA